MRGKGTESVATTANANATERVNREQRKVNYVSTY